MALQWRSVIPRDTDATRMAMSPDDPPSGARFSHVYLDRGEPRQDSARMRRRITALIRACGSDLDELGQAVEREQGVEVLYMGYEGHNWKAFLSACDLRDVLDLVTVAYRHLQGKLRTGIRDAALPRRWLEEIGRIFAEENVHYRVDDRGGVHFHFDEEFARNRAAAVAVLQAARFANALDAFENGMAALAQAPPDGKRGIRGVFAAVEAIFRLILPNAPRLGAVELNGLAALLQRLYAQDDTAQRSAGKMLGGLKDWVDAAHFYRHEEGAEEVAQPPLKLAVYIVSTGASHLRWLAEVDASLQQGGA
jgi:hypothetical protein